MILYHGSYTTVANPDLRKSAAGKDFGAGFYLTSDHEQAKAFIRTSTLKAIRTKAISSDHNKGAVSVFEFDETAPVAIFRFETTSAEWLQFISANRRPEIFSSEALWDIQARFAGYDIIIGKIADDATNRTITAYLSGAFGDINSEEAIADTIKRLQPERLNDQYCFLTESAIRALSFKEAEYYDIDIKSKRT